MAVLDTGDYLAVGRDGTVVRRAGLSLETLSIENMDIIEIDNVTYAPDDVPVILLSPDGRAFVADREIHTLCPLLPESAGILSFHIAYCHRYGEIYPLILKSDGVYGTPSLYCYTTMV